MSEVSPFGVHLDNVPRHRCVGGATNSQVSAVGRAGEAGWEDAALPHEPGRDGWFFGYPTGFRLRRRCRSYTSAAFWEDRRNLNAMPEMRRIALAVSKRVFYRGKQLKPVRTTRRTEVRESGRRPLLLSAESVVGVTNVEVLASNKIYSVNRENRIRMNKHYAVSTIL